VSDTVCPDLLLCGLVADRRNTVTTMKALVNVLREGLPHDEPESDEREIERMKNISDQLLRLVQVFFGVVAGQGLVLYRSVVVSPFDHDHIPATLALFSIYLMIVWSWIDWNMSMEDRPYDFRTSARRWQTGAERWRLYSDIVIVVLYSYMLFQVAPLVDDPNADIRFLLLGYPLVFLLYLVSGELRILRYGRDASKLRPIVEYLIAFLVLLGAYVVLWHCGVSKFWLNVSSLVVAMVTTYAYRRRRRSYRKARGTRTAKTT
jgi:hypothetical protein